MAKLPGFSGVHKKEKHYGAKAAKIELTFLVPESTLKSVLERDELEEWAGEQAQSFTEQLADDLVEVGKMYGVDQSKLMWVHFDD